MHKCHDSCKALSVFSLLLKKTLTKTGLTDSSCFMVLNKHNNTVWSYILAKGSSSMHLSEAPNDPINIILTCKNQVDEVVNKTFESYLFKLNHSIRLNKCQKNYSCLSESGYLMTAGVLLRTHSTKRESAPQLTYRAMSPEIRTGKWRNMPDTVKKKSEKRIYTAGLHGLLNK